MRKRLLSHIGLILVLVLLVLPLGSCQTAQHAPGIPDCWLEVVDGTRVLVLHGSAYDRGRAHGILLAHEIGDNCERYIDKSLQQKFGFGRDYLLKWGRKMEAFMPQEVVDEMHGISDGSGVPYEDILILATHVDTVQFGKPSERAPVAASLGALSCSSFALFGRWTSDGRLIAGHNVDWATDTGVEGNEVLIVCVPLQGVPFCMPTHCGMVGTNTGMNAAGITYGDTTSFSSDQSLDGMPLLIMARWILQNARTLDDAVEMVKTLPRTDGWNMVIGDGKIPDARALEVTKHRVVVFLPDDPKEEAAVLGSSMLDAVRRTNHFVDHELRLTACKRFGIDPEQIEQALSNAADSTQKRYDALKRFIQENDGPVNPGDAARFLGTPPVGNAANLQSVVYDPKNLEVWTANAAPDGTPACNLRYSRVKLSKYFK